MKKIDHSICSIYTISDIAVFVISGYNRALLDIQSPMAGICDTTVKCLHNGHSMKEFLIMGIIVSLSPDFR